jgi:predicted RNase H-like HicB family nuclease
MEIKYSNEWSLDRDTLRRLSGYFLALEGYNTWGKTYEEAIKHAEETLTLCFESFDDSANRPRKSEVSNNPPPSVTVRIPIVA